MPGFSFYYMSEGFDEKEMSPIDSQREVNERLDFLLRATDVEDIFDNIQNCIDTTDNTLQECYRDMLFVIRMGINLLESTLNKYSIKHREIKNLKSIYNYLNDYIEKISDKTTVGDIKNEISGEILKMSEIIKNLKNER